MRAEEVAEKEFITGMRGYVREEVRAYLRQVADQIRSDELRLQCMARALRAYKTEDPRALARLVGEETTKVLELAHTSAEEIRARAEQDADDIRAQARLEAEAIVARGHHDAELLRAQYELMISSADFGESDEAVRRIAGSLDGAGTMRLGQIRVNGVALREPVSQAD
jgi:cell division initiation protein